MAQNKYNVTCVSHYTLISRNIYLQSEFAKFYVILHLSRFYMQIIHNSSRIFAYKYYLWLLFSMTNFIIKSLTCAKTNFKIHDWYKWWYNCDSFHTTITICNRITFKYIYISKIKYYWPYFTCKIFKEGKNILHIYVFYKFLYDMLYINNIL